MRAQVAFGVLAALVLVAPAALSARRSPGLRTPDKHRRMRFQEAFEEQPATRYARLGREGCLAELRARKVRFSTLAVAPGVLAPVRLEGPLRGVDFGTAAPLPARRGGSADVMDCRLVLAADDWARDLAAAGVTRVVLASAWRPAKTPPGAAAASAPKTRHEGALALDVLRLEGRERLDVKTDFGPTPRRMSPCAADAVSRLGGKSKALRTLVCGAVRAKLFHVALTPAYDRAHDNHVHLEVLPDARGQLVL